MLEELAASAQASGVARGVTVELMAGDDASVEGEAFLLRRALANLIDNALDFSPANAKVTLRLLVNPRSVDVSVRDHGPGISDYAEDRCSRSSIRWRGRTRARSAPVSACRS